MEKKVIQREDFLAARKFVREHFNRLMPLIHAGKQSINYHQRSGTYEGLDFADESLGLGTKWQLQSTLCATALAHSRNRLHMTKFQSKMPGHSAVINSLADQEEFLEKKLNEFEELRSYAPMDSFMQSMLKSIAFSEKPEVRGLEKVELNFGIPEFKVPEFVEMNTEVSV